jgi:ORF6N domain
MDESVRVSLIPLERIERAILSIGGEKVMLDSDLALIYGVPTKVLNQAVKRNSARFPADFCFQLTATETEIVDRLRSQIVTSNAGRGGRRYLPYAFTEHGALMLANILNSERAAQTSVQVVRAFVRLRQMLASNAELARQLEALERKYDQQFKVVFDVIRRLMSPPEPKRREIGFHVKPDADARPKARKR